jgi:hypothetical protein
MAALAQEVARSTPELKAAFERGFKEILAARGAERKEAIFQSATLIDGVVLARAVQNEHLSEEILKNVRQKSKLMIVNWRQQSVWSDRRRCADRGLGCGFRRTHSSEPQAEGSRSERDGGRSLRQAQDRSQPQVGTASPPKRNLIVTP